MFMLPQTLTIQSRICLCFLKLFRFRVGYVVFCADRLIFLNLDYNIVSRGSGLQYNRLLCIRLIRFIGLINHGRDANLTTNTLGL
jgi:hypothetical protein